MLRPHRLAVVALVAGSAALAAGCSSILGLDWHRELGVLDTEGRLRGSLEAPAEVTRGVPFDVVITTYGSSSCTRPAGAETDVDGMLATVRPYDRVATGTRPCTMDMHAFPRTVQLRFDVAGDATIRVLGRNGAQVEQQVTVRP